MSPYRMRGIPPVNAPRGVHVSGGVLLDPPHECEPPGWWARRFYPVRYGSVWICACGQRWVFRQRSSDEWFFGIGEWRATSE